ncbi:MAG TPA: hypothetical protein VK673_02775, partial [Chthoniobacterales bacterium]|nr:hypothetical protein [Chthoniobacterales bacterium]
KLLPGRDRTGWIVWEAEINEIDGLLWDLRDKAVCLCAREINKALIGAKFVGWPGVAAHNVGVYIHGVNGIDDGDSILVAKNIQNITAIAFGTVRDKDLIVHDVHAAFTVIVLRDGVTEKFVPLLRAVAAKGFTMRELIDRPVHGLNDCGWKRLRNVPDSATHQGFPQVRMFVAERANSASDFWKEVAGFKFEIVIVKVSHGKN